MLTMTNDEAQDWLLAQHNAAPGPPDPARFGAAIRAIRAKAIADAKEWFGADTGELARLRERLARIYSTVAYNQSAEADKTREVLLIAEVLVDRLAALTAQHTEEAAALTDEAQP